MQSNEVMHQNVNCGRHGRGGAGAHLKLRGQNSDPFMGSISFNPYRGQINHDLGHFL